VEAIMKRDKKKKGKLRDAIPMLRTLEAIYEAGKLRGASQ